MVDDVDAEDSFEFVPASNNDDLSQLVEELVTGLDEDGQPRQPTLAGLRSPSRPAPSGSNGQGHRGGLSDSSVQAIRFPLEHGEVEPVPNDLMDRYPPGLLRDLDGGHSSQFSQGSQGSDMSHASLNEDSRSLRNASFDSSTGVGGLYSPAGSQPCSQSASLPIQYPSSQESALDGATFLERLQEIAAVVPDSRQRLLNQFGFGQQQ